MRVRVNPDKRAARWRESDCVLDRHGRRGWSQGGQDARARCAWAGPEDYWWMARLRSICALERLVRVID